MIPFRVIRSGVLLSGLLAGWGAPLQAASTGFTATLSREQKRESGLSNLSAGELATLDRLVAEDIARARLISAPALTDRYALRYTETETQQAGLDRLTTEQLAKLDELITSAGDAAPPPPPRERPRLRDDPILSERGRLQVHGGMSLTMGWAGGGRNYREVGAWVSYFDPVTGLGLSFGFSRFSGDFFPGYYGQGFYSNPPNNYSAPRTPVIRLDGASVDRNEFIGDGASLRLPTRGKSSDRKFRP